MKEEHLSLFKKDLELVTTSLNETAYDKPEIINNQHLYKRTKSKFFCNKSIKELNVSQYTDQNFEKHTVSPFRLYLKKGEYIYARPEDILMIESCDHMVKVYLGVDGKAILTVRSNTLKDFLLQLPKNKFIRISRFCAINLQRLSSGNYNKQTFEFDFKISIKLKYSISHSVFTAIGK